MKDELDGKIITNFAGLRSKTYSYLINDGSEDKKAKGRKKYVIERKLKFQIIEAVSKQLNLAIKQIIYKKIKLMEIVSYVTKKNKEFVKNKKLVLKT